MIGRPNNRILITGGAGFLGRGIMRQAARENWPVEFTIYSRDEFKQHRCRDAYPNAGYVLGDIRDTDRLALIMRGHDLVIHAAALKYVPEAENNVDECIGINVYGSQSVVKAAYEARVKQVIAISTDKAVEPVNTYGLSKAVAERVFGEASRLMPDIKFTTCRYGNVIGSTGSVIPVFQHQLETLGKVLVTDPDMTRFWISVDEAVDIIELAMMQDSGTITVPMPKAMRIGDIAAAIAGEAVEVVGVRPGEKLHEKLLTYAESMRTKTDMLFDMDYNIYNPSGPPLRAENQLFELCSSRAERITPEEFVALAQDSETV